MRTQPIFRLTLLAAILFALSLGGCSDTPVTPPQTTDPVGTDDEPSITILQDLQLNRQALLVDQPASVVARIRLDAPEPYAIQSVALHSVDAAGESVEQLTLLLDDGQTGSSDVMAGDKVYSGVTADLLYATPDTLNLSVRVIATADGEEDLDTWTEVRILPVFATHLVFTSGPTAFPQGITTASTTDLRVVSELMVADSLTLRSVDLYRVTAENDSVVRLGPLADNGNLDNGDEIMADGNYTAIVRRLFIVAPQTVYLRALATATSESSGLTHQIWSPTLEVPVEYPPSEGLVNVVLANQDSLEARWQSLLADDTEPAAARDSLLAWMDGRDHILDNYLSPDGATIWTVYFNGFEAGVMLPVEGATPVYGASLPPRPGAAPASSYMDVGTPAARSGAQVPGTRNPEFPDEVDSNIALVYSPFHSWTDALPGQDDPAVAVADLFDEAHCPSFGVEKLYDEAADLAGLQELYRYGAIALFTHGVQLAGGQVALLTGETVSYERCVRNAWDLFTFDPAVCVVRNAGESYFAVKPGFFVKYTPHFPNTIVQVVACYGAATNSLPMAFLDNGAGYFTGFDGSVGVEFAASSSLSFWTNVLEIGDRTGPAFEAVSPQVEPGHEFAQFTSQGNPDLYFGTDMQNGNFELGSLSAWYRDGDGRVISRLDDQLPVDGNAMGIISTGLGYTESTGEIAQVVCLPAGATTLSLSYNFFSEEFLEFCGSGYQDYFKVAVVDAFENETELFYINIDAMCEDVVPTAIRFDREPVAGEPGVYRTGWRALELNVAPWAGQTVTLRFAAGDIGDSIYDSAILIDAIRID